LREPFLGRPFSSCPFFNQPVLVDVVYVTFALDLSDIAQGFITDAVWILRKWLIRGVQCELITHFSGIFL